MIAADLDLVKNKDEREILQLVIDQSLSVTKTGLVKNNKTGRVIGAVGSGGYPKITVSINGRKRIAHAQIHRLVWLIYQGNILDGHVIDHIDDDKNNCELGNLQSISGIENTRKAVPKKKRKFGQENCNSKLKNDEVLYMRDYGREKKKVPIKTWMKKFGCHRQTIISAISGKTYSHLNDTSTPIKLKPQKRLSQEMIKRIKVMRANGKSGQSISNLLGVNRNTVMKHW